MFRLDYISDLMFAQYRYCYLAHTTNAEKQQYKNHNDTHI